VFHRIQLLRPMFGRSQFHISIENLWLPNEL
jgi:hypothetical protein